MSSCSASPQVYGTAPSRACPPSNCCPKKTTFQQRRACCPTDATSNDWIEYVPTITNGTPATSASIIGKYKIIDEKTVVLKFTYSQTNNTGAADGSVPYIISYPDGVVPVLNLVSEIGGAAGLSDGTNSYLGAAFLTSSGMVIDAMDATTNPRPWSNGLVPFTTPIIVATFTVTFERY